MKVCLGAIGRVLLVSAAISVPAMTMAPNVAFAQVGISVSVNVEPPGLPSYEQPPIPSEGYIWTPGYWAWDASDNDYYWAPGAWVQPPQVGVLWTPGYWAWNNGVYVFYEGYWATTVGFYGGVDYGYGYTPDGYYGGRWENGQFAYNRSVTNITNVNITNVYEAPVPASQNASRASFNGGNGGTTARPTAEQQSAAKQEHVRPTAEQMAQANAAKEDPKEHFKTNHGKPDVAATAKAGDLKEPSAASAKSLETKPAEAKAPEAKPMESRTPETKAAEKRAPAARPNEAKAPEAKPMERKTPETRAVEQKAPEAKPMESRAATERPEPRTEAPRAGEPARTAEPASRPMDAGAAHANAASPHAVPEGGKGANCGKPKCD